MSYFYIIFFSPDVEDDDPLQGRLKESNVKVKNKGQGEPANSNVVASVIDITEEDEISRCVYIIIISVFIPLVFP